MNCDFHRLLKGLSNQLALALGLAIICAASAFSSQRRGKTPIAPVAENIQWETFLIKGEPQPTFRFAVAHQHAATGCYGYLYISRDEIWYEVKAPAKDRDHAFREPRSSVTEARQWRFMGSSMPEVEFKFSRGNTYHFFRLRESLLAEPNLESKKLRWEDIRSWEPLVQAVQNFDAMASLAEQRQAALAPKPLPTVALKAEPSSVEKGHAVTLTWSSANATSLDLEPGIGPVQANGSREIVPTDSTTYVITVLGPGGNTSAVEHVTVNVPASPPTIVLVEPSVAGTGLTIDVTKSPLTIRGVAMDNSGLPAVTINGVPAAMRSQSSQAAEFSSDPIVLQPGENKFEISAVNAAHAEAKVIFTARYTPPPPPVKPQPVAEVNPKALAKADIIDLLKGDVPSERVAALVKDRGIKFVPSEDDLKEIRAAGGGDDLIDGLKQAATTPK
ncbi:MAG: phage tail family protein [Terriglobia bacterium]